MTRDEDAHAPLREEFAAEAARHRPDRAAMLRRIERGRIERGRAERPGAAPRRSGLRAAGIALAIAATLGLSVAGTWAAVGHYTEPSRTPTVAPTGTVPQVGRPTSTPKPGGAAPGPSRSAGAGSRAPSGVPTATATASPSASGAASAAPSPTASAATRAQQGFLWSDGSIDPHSLDSWGQSDITVKNHLTVTALSVEIRVALTPGLADSGTWSTVPAAELVSTVTRDGDALVYRFTLKPGSTLAPGTYEFAGQYNHAAGGRDAGADSYRATATARGTGVEVYGNFYPVG